MRQNKTAEYDVDTIREQFPILKTTVHDKPLIYLDNAATTQKPNLVIEAVSNYYRTFNANIHRGVHYLSVQATEHYEQARLRVANFLGVPAAENIVFTRGATEGINLVAQCFGRDWVKPGDEVLITELEHHSNIVPWQILCNENNATLRLVPITNSGEIDLDEFDRFLNSRTKVVAVTHVSNALGTVNPVKDICKKAREQGAISLVDGAQSVPHSTVNIRELGADFFVCSAHKMYGPSGIGMLYGKPELLEQMRPYQTGSGMILSVSLEKTRFAPAPYKFEAGTPAIEAAIGWAAAIDFLEHLTMDNIAAYSKSLLEYGTQRLQRVPGISLVGTAKEKIGIIAFVMEGIHPHDIGHLLDHSGMAVRAGHQCAQPLMQKLGLPGLVRVSLGLYNTKEELDLLANALQEIVETFA